MDLNNTPWKFSVIIRTKNSEATIYQTLQSLFSQTILPERVIVVDSESKDSTLSIVKSCGIENIQQISANDYFPGKILNQMIQQIQTELIVFLNSDAALLTPLALQSLLHPFHRPNVKGTFARQIPRPDAFPWVVRDYQYSFPSQKPAPHWIPFSLCFAAIRKETWEQHPFYTQSWGSEDTEWGVWAKQQGYEIEYVPESLIMHSHNYTCKQIYGRRFVEGEADAFIYHRSLSIMNFFIRFIKSVINDLIFYMKMKQFKWMHQIIPVRFVYHWAYYKGNRLGNWRKQHGNEHAEIGQKEVLSRYEKKNTN